MALQMQKGEIGHAARLCLAARRRQRESTSKTAAEADVDDEFDDEETFLNLDDVLEGPPSNPAASPTAANCSSPARQQDCIITSSEHPRIHSIITMSHVRMCLGRGTGHRPQ